MSRPRGGPYRQLGIWIESAVDERIGALAARTESNKADLVRRALAEFLAREESRSAVDDRIGELAASAGQRAG